MISRRNMTIGLMLLGATTAIPSQLVAQTKKKTKKIVVTSKSLKKADIEGLIREKLPKGAAPSDLREFNADAKTISRQASRMLAAQSDGGTRDVEIEICGRRICVTIRFRRRRRNS